MPFTTREELERECRERAEPFCDCGYYKGDFTHHAPSCAQERVYAALLKMAEDTGRACAEVVHEHEREAGSCTVGRFLGNAAAAIERLVGGEDGTSAVQK